MKTAGFTLIEVILFLAISGMMIAGLLASMAGSVNRERYEESVSSFNDYLNGQYNLVDNVRNNRTAVLSGCSGAERGTSDCTIVGRFVVTTDGRTFTSQPIIAEEAPEFGNTMITEKEQFAQMKLRAINSATDGEQYTLPWQATIVAPNTQDPPLSFRLAIVRSPLSHSMRTYYAAGASGTVDETIVAATTTGRQALCVRPDGVNTRMLGVTIDQGGVNSSAVQFATGEICNA